MPIPLMILVCLLPGVLIGSLITSAFARRMMKDNAFLREDNSDKRSMITTTRNRLKNALNTEASGWTDNMVIDEACHQLMAFRTLAADMKQVINNKQKSFQALGHTFTQLTPRNEGGKFQKKAA